MTHRGRLIADLIRDRGRWTQQLYAIDKDKKPCDPAAPEAVKWCAEGAGLKLLGRAAFEAFKADFKAKHTYSPTMFNDRMEPGMKKPEECHPIILAKLEEVP